ncbi:MAG: DegT/DnrJ/EryC1/StrS family aminotransferase [Opitutaceae bacterium]|nr:DegT/DnrJ/EryC1/StrS family aminotransferase [Opitutaceae bacterium]
MPDRKPRVYLSSPHLGGDELRFVTEAFASNWIAPLGPSVDAFEAEFAARVGTAYAAALSSGTAALHLAMRWLRLQPGDEVICSTFTFSATVNPILYERARPVFVDCERESWNMSPALLAEAITDRVKRGRVPKAVVLAHIYGQSADLDPIVVLCARHGIPLIEDAAEALGATYRGRAPGSVGLCGIHSFNGNKIITTSGGGMLVSNDAALIEKARYWATQARDPAPHYQHSEIGFNYRMSNVLAAIGRGQLRVLDDRVAARRAHNEAYQAGFADTPGIEFMPEAAWGRSTRWLTCVLVDPEKFGADREAVRQALEAENIEVRPVWKPMHLQPVFAGSECYGGAVAEDLFARGLCLPSGSNLTLADRERVIAAVKAVARRG